MRKKPRLNSEFANNKKSLKYYLHVVLWDLPHAHYGQERNFLARLGNDVDLKIFLNRFPITSDFLKHFFQRALFGNSALDPSPSKVIGFGSGNRHSFPATAFSGLSGLHL